MQQLISDIQRSYGLSVSDARRLDGGYLNCLWYLRTDRGERLAKQFSPRRYTPEKLDALEAALLRQETVRQMGVACPQIFLYKGHALRRTDAAHAYCIMEFCPGKNETAESIGVGQAESLGSACAAVHNAFSHLPVQDVKGFPIREETLLPELWANYHNKAAVLDGTPPEYQAALLAQPAILEQLDAGFFIRQPKGIAHEDFTPDNVLFDDGGVRAVIDFDRNRYSFPLHDLGRAMLSFMRRGETLDQENLSAFVRGYTQRHTLHAQDPADALRITWCMESLWWINPESFSMPPSKATRFRDDIVWLTRHWEEIDAIFRSL